MCGAVVIQRLVKGGLQRAGQERLGQAGQADCLPGKQGRRECG